MISCLTEVGRLGLTAVGDTADEAWELYQEAQAVLLRGGGPRAAGRPRARLSLALGTDDPVWYVAYGSNLRAARFGCYLAGGRPDGACRATTAVATAPRRAATSPSGCRAA